MIKGLKADWVLPNCTKCGKPLKGKVPPEALPTVVCFDCNEQEWRKQKQTKKF